MADPGRTSGRASQRFASLWVLGGLALCWAAALTVVFAVRVRDRFVPENVQIASFRHPVGALQHLAALSDAQAFIAVGRDPAIRHLQVWIEGPVVAALRFSRPVVGYLVWVVSLGQPDWAPYALAVISCVSCAATIVLSAKLLGGERRWLVLVLLVTPTYLATIDYMGADFTALALALGGLLAWRSGRGWLAVALFALGGLAHDHYLLIPLALLAWESFKGTGLRHAVRLVWTPVPYCLWIVFLHDRIGAWPWDSGNGNLGTPFRGLAQATSHWDVLDAVAVIGLLGLTVTAFLVGSRGVYLWIVATYVIFSAWFAVLLWNWATISRVTLPLVTFAWLAIANPFTNAPLSTATPSPGGLPHKARGLAPRSS